MDDDKTLHELDIKDDEVLLFAKRFFSADYNVDKDDPVQLHLIYVQVCIVFFKINCSLLNIKLVI